MSSITEDQPQRLLEHYAVGLRGILAEHDDLADPALTQKMRALRDDAPVRLEHRFWGAQFFAMAFGHELGFAAAHPPALRAIFNLGVVTAEHGLTEEHQGETLLNLDNYTVYIGTYHSNIRLILYIQVVVV